MRRLRRAAAYSVPPTRTAASGILRPGMPAVTYALIAANVAVFVLQMASRCSSSSTLFPVAVAGGQYRLITSAFTTGSLHPCSTCGRSMF